MVCAVRKPLLFDTQNPRILGFSTAHAYKYKTKRQAEIKRDSRKMTFLLISHQASLVLEKHRFAHRPQTSKENRDVVLFCYAEKLSCVSQFFVLYQGMCSAALDSFPY